MVMMRRGVRAVGERSHRETPQERGYRRLGAAVIVSAVRDLEKPTRAGGESVRAGESARAFLTVSNSNLKFWCRVADVDMNAILRTYCQGGRSRESSAMSNLTVRRLRQEAAPGRPVGFMENRRGEHGRKSGSAP